MPNPIWESFWSDTVNHEWWKRPAQEVLQFIDMQSVAQRPKVLDLGCGLGRHAIAFALAGFQVTATDVASTAIKHLDRWAAEVGVCVKTKICDILDDETSQPEYDIVLSYNVIYHGYREDFARAISYVHSLLKCGGVFFFTCPTRRDGKYGHGEQVAPHTFLCTKSMTPGDIHYFADEQDFEQLLEGFRTVSRHIYEGYWDNNGTQQRYSNWTVITEKTE